LYGINPGWLRSFQFSPTYDGIHTGADSPSYTTIHNSPDIRNAIRASCSSSNSFQLPPSIWPTLYNVEITVSVAASILSIGSQESRPNTWQSINWCPRRVFIAHGHLYVGLSRVTTIRALPFFHISCTWAHALGCIRSLFPYRTNPFFRIQSTLRLSWKPSHCRMALMFG
jgi:hypothetical protein